MVEVPSRDSQKRTFAVAIAVVLSKLAKRASRLPLKLKAAAASPSRDSDDDWKIELRSPAPTKSPLTRPKKLMRKISSKTMSFIKMKKGDKEGDWGYGGVWQKEILMGDKCEPLDFSGVIYYDSNGKQVSEIPSSSSASRSPRASPVPATPTYFIRQRRQLKLSYSE